MIDVGLLRIENLIAMLEEFKTPETVFKNANILPKQSGLGQEVLWDILKAQRDVDTFEGKFSSAGQRKLSVIGQQGARLARTFKSTFVPGSVLMDLRTPGTPVARQVVAKERVAQELKFLADLMDRQDEFMISQALQGTLAMTVNDVTLSIDYGIQATHKPTSTGNWHTTPAFDVLEDIRAWKELVSKDSGYVLSDAWCSSKLMTSLMKNTVIKNYFEQSPLGGDMIREGRINRLLGIDWHVYDWYYDAAGTLTRALHDDKVIFHPKPDGQWGHFRGGSDIIPTDDKKDMREVQGRYAYASITENPASIALYAGDVRLPIISIPDALLIADVTV